MVKHGEPGMCFNFGENSNETLRNACAEFTSEDDSDVCNLGSVNLGNITTIQDFTSVVELASKFLVCGTIRGDLPYQKVKEVREQNRKIGLGLMGVHEWLLQRGYSYEVTPELHKWMEVYRDASEQSANEHCDRFYINRPKKYRAIAPAGTIGILASTTTGIEPLYAVAFKRRYLEGGSRWKYQYVIDATADRILKDTGVKADEIETAYDLAKVPEQRIKFQADIQDYVDMGISSTLNLPARTSDADTKMLGDTIFKYCTRLRGITCYPDGARGGQPLTPVDYETAATKRGVIFDETEEKCGGTVCGI
jgi:ribonucleoside-diphosphate reductase alpha chain